MNLSKQNNRKSNIELLRIIIMFAIFINHMISHGILLDTLYKPGESLFIQSIIKLGISVWIPAAMIFVLISGYWGIKPSWKSLIKFSVLCAFYSMFSYIIGNKPFTFIGLLKSIIFISERFTGLWFVSSYFYLYCMTPIINTWLCQIDKQKMKIYLICFILADITLGFLMDNKLISMPIHFVLLYSIGHYLKVSNDNWIIKSTIPQCLLGWLITTSVLFVLAMLFNNPHKCFHYMNPIITGQSIFILLVFTKIRIRNSIRINYLAASTFPVYLLSENINTRDYFVQGIQFLQQYLPHLLFIATFIFLCTISYFALIFIDKFFSLIYKPITNKRINTFKL